MLSEDDDESDSEIEDGKADEAEGKLTRKANRVTGSKSAKRTHMSADERISRW